MLSLTIESKVSAERAVTEDDDDGDGDESEVDRRSEYTRAIKPKF